MLLKKRKEEKARVEIGVEKEEGPERRGELIIYTPEVKSQQQVCTLPFDRATAVPAFLPNVVLRLIEAILTLSSTTSRRVPFGISLSWSHCHINSICVHFL